MTYRRDSRGFTLIEVLAAMAIFSIGILTISGIAASLQQAQRNNQYLNLASIAAKNIIENYRTNQINNLQYDVSVPVTNEPILTSLPGGTASIVARNYEGIYGIKNLEVTVTYTVGSNARSVFMSSLGGEQGLVQ